MIPSRNPTERDVRWALMTLYYAGWIDFVGQRTADGGIIEHLVFTPKESHIVEMLEARS